MKKDHMTWLSKNISLIEKIFCIENIMSAEKRNEKVYKDFVDVYDTKEDFDNAFVDLPCIDEGESAFDFLKNIGTADIVAGKFVHFDFRCFDDLFPNKRFASN